MRSLRYHQSPKIDFVWLYLEMGDETMKTLKKKNHLISSLLRIDMGLWRWGGELIKQALPLDAL